MYQYSRSYLVSDKILYVFLSYKKKQKNLMSEEINGDPAGRPNRNDSIMAEDDEFDSNRTTLFTQRGTLTDLRFGII